MIFFTIFGSLGKIFSAFDPLPFEEAAAFLLVFPIIPNLNGTVFLEEEPTYADSVAQGLSAVQPPDL
jgi:hypothetical protein